MAQAIIGKFTEPQKYRKADKNSRWVITDEWKEWIKKRRAAEAKPKGVKRKKIVTAENHSLVWKEVACQPDSGKRIFFCACMSNQGDPYKGCGAAGVQQSRASAIHEVIGSRFE